MASIFCCDDPDPFYDGVEKLAENVYRAYYTCLSCGVWLDPEMVKVMHEEDMITYID